MKARPLNQWRIYFEARESGLPVVAAARRAKFSEATGYRFEKGEQSSTGLRAAEILGITTIAGNIVAQPLSLEAERALEDFAYFRLRYFGRRSTPWQTRAAYEVLKALDSPEREYLIINAPPGSGKSTIFTVDIPCWVIVKRRTVRYMLGSRTEKQARMYTGRIKKALEREVPMRATADNLMDGVSMDAEACLLDDFGAFKPESRNDLWRADAFTVRQTDGVAVDDKEPTVSAWGQESGFLGGRFDLVVWDDLVDRSNTKRSLGREGMQEWWTTEAETRLEPRGAFILQGQRIAHNDLYRFCLDMKTMEETPKYHRIVYQAHDESRCNEEVMNTSHEGLKPWPESCLLDPRRLPWKMLQTIKNNEPRTFDVQYQQNDGDLVGGLIDEAWIKGGLDGEGYDAPGCLDRERPIGVIPEHLLTTGWSFVTVDPSPTEWWGVIWWVYDEATENRYAIDIVRRRMNPEQFLSMDLDDGTFTGVLEDLVVASEQQGSRITDVIFEANAAQKWFLSQPIVQRWQAQRGVQLIPHTTHINKWDPKFGLESIGDLFRQGKIRLPYADVVSRMRTQALVDEGTRYPDGETTDLIMSTWFGKLGVENHYRPRNRQHYRMATPTWIRPQGRGLPDYAR